MRKLIIAVIVLMLGIPALTSRAAATPIYAVAYPHAAGYRLAIRYSDQSWQMRDIPSIPLVNYERGAAQTPAKPRWSPDGKTLYLTGYPPGDTTSPAALFAYDLASGQITPVLTAPKIGGCTKAYIVESISPDGRYALMCSGFEGGDSDVIPPAIIDLQQKKVVSTDFVAGQADVQNPSGCSVGAVAWAMWVNRLVAISDCGLMTRLPVLTTVDTQTWKVLSQQSELDHNIGATVFINGPKPYILYETVTANGLEGEIKILRVDSGRVDKLADGVNLLVPGNLTFAAFIQNDRLMRLDLASFKVTDAGPITHRDPEDRMIYMDLREGNDKLNYLDIAHAQNDQVDIALITLTATRRSEGKPFYHGPTPLQVIGDWDCIAVAPPGYVEVYKADKLIWSSKAQYTSVSLLNLVGPLVTIDVEDASGGRKQLEVDVENGNTTTITPASLPEYDFINESPDGVWAVYFDMSAAGSGRTVLYNQKTAETITLFDSDTVKDESNVAPQEFISWSPMMGKP